MTLKDKSVSDIAAIQGMLSSLGMTQYDPSVSLAAQLPSSQKGLTEQQQTRAETQLKDWYKELSGYINKPFTGHLMLTLKGKLMLDGHLDGTSVQLFIADGNDLVPAEDVLPPLACEREQNGTNHMNEILQGTLIPGASLRYTYDRIAAREYADQYTSTVTASPYYNTTYWIQSSQQTVLQSARKLANRTHSVRDRARPVASPATERLDKEVQGDAIFRKKAR